MSEQLDESIPEREEQRSLYGEQALSHNYETLTMPQLQEKLQQFIDFTLDPTTLPSHKKIVRDMMDYLIAEIDWRVSRGVE